MLLLRYYHLLRIGAPIVLSLLRIVAALVLLEHGTQKMFDFPPMPRFAGFPGAGGPAQAAAPAGGGLAAQAERTAPTAAGASVAPTTGQAAEPATTATAGATTPLAAGGGAAGGPPRAGGPRGPGGPGGGGPPSYFALFPLAGWIETVAGALLVIGLFSRSAAFLLSGETAVVYFIAHLPNGFYPISNGGEAAVLFCWTFLYIFFAGPGPISVDALWRRVRGALGARPAATPVSA